MAQDLFKEDILENAITQKQLERKERRESLRIKKEEQERKQAEAAAKAKKRRKIMLIAIAVLLVAGFVFGRAVYRISELKKEKAQAEAKLEALQEKLDQLDNSKHECAIRGVMIDDLKNDIEKLKKEQHENNQR